MTQAAISPTRQALPFYYALVLAMLTAGAVFLLVRLEQILVILFLSLLVAAAVARPASSLERRGVPRGIAVAIVFLVFFGIVGTLAWFAIPRFLADVERFARAIPGYTSRLDSLRRNVETLREHYPQVTSLEAQSRTFGEHMVGRVAGRLTEVPTRLLEGIFNLMSVVLLAVMLVTMRDRLLAFVLSMVRPAYREKTRQVLTKMWIRLGFYIRVRLIVMVILAVLTWVTLKPIGMPYAVLLATLTGLAEVVPRYGSLLARIPLLGIAAFEGWKMVVIVFIASFVVETVKSHLISPFIEGGQLHIHPLLSFIAILAGAALLGLLILRPLSDRALHGETPGGSEV